MKIGRNAPCPCGSGKKYKKCCLGKENVSNDLLWRRLGDAYDRLSKNLMNHGRQVFGTNEFAEALDEFFVWPEEELVEEALVAHEQMLYPWYLFNWIHLPDEEEEEEGDTTPAGLEEKTIAASYQKSKGANLDPLERRLINAIEGRPFTFYEIIDCQPGIGYRVKDFFLGDVIDVKEKMGSENVQKGDLLFGRVATIDAISMLFGSGSIIIRPTWKPYLIQFRTWLQGEETPITTETLAGYDVEIREVYFAIFEKMMRPPEMQNTDGDPMRFHTLYYDIKSPEVAFQALRSLSAVETEEALRSQTTLTDDGGIEKIEIPWTRKGFKSNPALESTVLGRIEIYGRKMKVEVNSDKRAETIKKEIEKRLGPRAKYKTMEIRSLESMLEKGQQKGLPDTDEKAGRDDLMQLPEVQQQMRAMLQGHWQNWIDERIPALGGKTPRQAVKTQDGKESVEALLLDAERHTDYNEPMQEIENKAIKDVRRKLGLDKTALPGPKPVNHHDKKSNRVETIKTMLEDFGREELNPLYIGFAIELLNKISRMRKLNIQRGHIEIWAAAIVYVIARLNFLFDPESDVSLSPDTICDYFGTVKSTVGNKASFIQKTCDLYYGAKGFCRQDIIDMVTFVETPEGFILPKNMLDINTKFIKPAKSNRQAKKKQEKPKDDKQLKLFDD
jgi:hypothetical protein